MTAMPGLTAAEDDVGRPFGWLARVLDEERRFAHRNEALARMAHRWAEIAKAEGVRVPAKGVDAAEFVRRATAALTDGDLYIGFCSTSKR